MPVVWILDPLDGYCIGTAPYCQLSVKLGVAATSAPTCLGGVNTLVHRAGGIPGEATPTVIKSNLQKDIRVLYTVEHQK